MIESVLHFLKIHRKMIFGNPAVVVQNMFRKTPKTLNAVDMIFRLSINEHFGMVHTVMLPETLQRVVAPKRVRVVDRAFSRFLPDDRHQLVLADVLNDFRIHAPIALQKAKYDAFASRSSSSLALASAAEICLVEFNLAFQFLSFKFRNVIDRFAESLVYSAHGLVVQIEVMSKTIRRLLFVEAADDRNLFLQLLQGFLFSTGLVAAANVPAFRPVYLERTAVDALPSPQKVGRTTENVVSSCNHKDILASFGYESN